MRFYLVFLVLFVTTGCQSVLDVYFNKPKYIKKISAQIESKTKYSPAHKIVAEYGAETGAFYQFEKDYISKHSIFIGYKPQSFTDLNLVANELSVVFNDMVKLNVCNGEYISNKSKTSNFSVTCIGSGSSSTPQIIWHKCSEFTTVCHSEYWTVK